jgi:hypothetical protein
MRRLFIETTKPPTYLFSKSKFSKSAETKFHGALQLLEARPAQLASKFCFHFSALRRFPWSVAVFAASVRGLLGSVAEVRKRLFQKTVAFLKICQKTLILQG